MPCVARPGASLARHGGTADAAWVSLLTVRAILAQVKLSFSPGSTTRQHSDFHNGPVAGDLGCGKIETRRSLPGGRLPPRDGETAPRRTYTPCGRTCGQRVAVGIDLTAIRVLR